MFLSQKIPWLSLSLLGLSYGVFGWMYSQAIPGWIDLLLVHKIGFSESILLWIFSGLGAGFVILISVALTAPLTLIQILFGEWIESDRTAVISVLLWALAVVVIGCLITYFIRLLVLISAAMLARIDLQNSGYSQEQSIIILAGICLLGYSCGLGFFISK